MNIAKRLRTAIYGIHPVAPSVPAGWPPELGGGGVRLLRDATVSGRVFGAKSSFYAK